MGESFIEFRDITKHFGGVTALAGVTFSIGRGEVHALMGENGAGKSTLGKILCGIHRADDGTIAIGGQEVAFRSPADAKKSCVGMVHQELAFCPDLSVAENLCMGRWPGKWGIVDRGRMTQEATSLLSQIGVEMDVTRMMRELTTGQEQLVQIAAAVGTGARVLVFDEPTSSLSEAEALRLFELIESLRERDVTIIYVSHRLPEVRRLCDRVSVLRDGKFVGTLERAEATEERIVRMMIGRDVDLSLVGERAKATSDSPAIRVHGLSSAGKFSDVSFDVKAGEIVGFAGLVGAGRSEVAQAVFGLDKRATGRIEVGQKQMRVGDVRAAMRRGIGLVPEDRKRQGLVLMMGGRGNFSLAMLERMTWMGVLDRRKERRGAEEYFARLRVKTPSIETPVENLSGGNQQKVVLAKWLGRGGKVLIVDEPTRGVDVGTKAAIHEIIRGLAREGVAVILISSEMPEVLGLSSRILVMREGKVVGQVKGEQATQEGVMRMMAGVGER